MAIKRAERVGPLILEEIAQVLITRLRDPRLQGVTFTRVAMTGDLKIARVYYSLMGESEAIAAAGEALAGAKGVFKRAIAALNLRYLPDLEFLYDPNLAYADRIDRVLREIHDQEQKTESEPNDESRD
jgi:ribosome-binding factor A